MGSSVITWQRGLEVVHSFYHSRDQLDRQNPHYVNRTSLYREEMAKGNASLRLDQVTLEDEGLYTCSVSTQIGSQKKSFRLKVAGKDLHSLFALLENYFTLTHRTPEFFWESFYIVMPISLKVLHPLHSPVQEAIRPL